MKKINRLCLAALLTLTLTLSVSAGEIECGVTATPPPTQPIAGQIECGNLGVDLTEAVYAALKGVWMVF